MSTSVPPVSSSTVPTVPTASVADYANRVPMQQLDQNDFLQLLVTKLTSQDPLNPEQDTEFIGQMAQFSALQSSNSMQSELQTLHANQLLGQTVEVKIDDTNTLVGQVTAIDSSKSQPTIIVGDHAYSLGDVVRVQQTATATNVTA